MTRLVSYVRSLRATPLGRYIPGNKVLGGALAGVVTGYLAKQHVVAVPPLYVALGAFALVSYLLPESPVAAAHVIATRHGATVDRTTKNTDSVFVGVVDPPEDDPEPGIRAQNVVITNQAPSDPPGPVTA